MTCGRFGHGALRINQHLQKCYVEEYNMSPLRCILPVVWFLCFSEISGYFEGESCHSFAGGSVYPQGSPKYIDHKLTWTKAVSK